MEVGNSSTTHYNSRSDYDQHRNFTVLKNLKSAEGQCDQLYNRIRILQQNDESYARKMVCNQNRIEKLEKIKNQSKKDQVKIDQLKKVDKEKLDERKKKNKDLKESIIKQSQANLQHLTLKKEEIHKQITKQSKINHRKIESLKLQSIEERRQKRDAIVLGESRSKQNIMEYVHKKNQTIHEQQAIERAFLARKQQRKLVEIENLSRIEMEMVKKSSESQQAFKNVKNRLDNMLGRIRNGKSQSKKKFKQVDQSLTKSESFYVLNQIRQ